MALIEDKELRCRLARNGQELARLLTFDRFIDAYESAFQKYARTA